MKFSNTYLITFLSILFVSLAVSCTKESLDELEGGQSIEFTVLTPGADVVSLSTKDTQDGETSRNENVVETLHYFLWPLGATNQSAVISDVKEFDSDDLVFRISVNDAIVEQLFPGGARQCVVYAIANLPEGVTVPSDPKLADLKALEVQADFKYGSSFVAQDSFVMTFEGNAILASKRKTIVANADVQLKRLASKLDVSVSTVSTYTDDSHVTWTSNPSTLRIKYFNAVRKADLIGDRNYNSYGFSYSDYAEIPLVNSVYTSYPFYTYPMDWEQGVSSYEPYVMISLQWTPDDGSGQKACYYKVFLPGTSFSSNTWYHLSVQLSILGSFTEDRPTVKLPDDLYYYVVDWKNSIVGGSGDGSGSGSDGDQTDPNVNAVIADARYLVFSQTTFTMNNIDDLSIPFGSSHNCVLADSTGSTTATIYGEVTNLSAKTASKDKVQINLDSATNPRSFQVSVDNDNRMVIIHHALRNDFTAGAGNYDCTPYRLRIRIQHAAETVNGTTTDYGQTYYEDIIIYQYPAIYASAQTNSGYSSTNYDYRRYGYVYINSKTQNGSNINTSGNSNPNMYVITTTVLPSSSSYMLGDPRTRTVTSISSTISAPSVESTTERNLKYYYSASNSSEYENIIAPKFRIASSYGASSTMSYSDAQKRCATYQEDGHPAGRWRLASKAEIFYMCQLTTDKVIPRLLGNDTGGSTTDYWCGSGYVTVYDGSSTNDPVYTASTSGNKYTRCIYDEWYWENSAHPTCTKTTFTWGDEQR